MGRPGERVGETTWNHLERTLHEQAAGHPDRLPVRRFHRLRRLARGCPDGWRVRLQGGSQDGEEEAKAETKKTEKKEAKADTKTEKMVFFGSVKLFGSGVDTPGNSSDSWEKLRPLRGMFRMVVSERTSPTTASWVWRIGVTPVTSIVCANPIRIVRSTRAFCPDSS